MAIGQPNNALVPTQTGRVASAPSSSTSFPIINNIHPVSQQGMVTSSALTYEPVQAPPTTMSRSPFQLTHAVGNYFSSSQIVSTRQPPEKRDLSCIDNSAIAGSIANEHKSNSNIDPNGSANPSALRILTKFIEKMLSSPEMQKANAYEPIKNQVPFPKRFHQVREKIARNELLIERAKLDTKISELVKIEKDYALDSTSQELKITASRTETACKAYLKHYVKQAIEYEKIASILGSPTEEGFILEFETEREMRQWIPIKPHMDRRAGRVNFFKNKYAENKQLYGVTDDQVRQRISSYLQTMGKKVLTELLLELDAAKLQELATGLDLSEPLTPMKPVEPTKPIEPAEAIELTRINAKNEKAVDRALSLAKNPALFERLTIGSAHETLNYPARYYKSLLAIRKKHISLTLSELKMNMLEHMQRAKKGVLRSSTGSAEFWQQNSELKNNLQSLADLTDEVETLEKIFLEHKQDRAPLGVSPKVQRELGINAEHNLVSMSSSLDHLQMKYNKLLNDLGFSDTEVKSALSELMEHSSAKNILFDTLTQGGEFADLLSWKNALDENFPKTSTMDVLSPEAESAFNQIYQKIVDKNPQLTSSLESIAARRLNGNAKYHLTNAAMAERGFMRSWLEFKYDLQSILFLEKKMSLQARPSIREFWAANQVLRRKLSLVIKFGIDYEKFNNVIKKGNERFAPKGVSTSQVYNIGSANVKKIPVLDAEIAARETEINRQLACAGDLAQGVERRVDELLQSPDTISTMLDAFAKDSDFISPELAKAFAEADQATNNAELDWLNTLDTSIDDIAKDLRVDDIFATLIDTEDNISAHLEFFDDLSDGTATNIKTLTQEGIGMFRKIFDRFTADIQPITSKAHLSSIKRDPKSKYLYARAGLAEKRFLIAREEIKTQILEALLKEEDVDKLTTKDFWQNYKHQDLRKRLINFSALEHFFEKTYKQLIDNKITPLMDKNKISSTAACLSKKFSNAEKDFAKAQENYHQKADSLGAQRGQFESLVNPLLSSAECAEAIVEELLKSKTYLETIEDIADVSEVRAGIDNKTLIRILDEVNLEEINQSEISDKSDNLQFDMENLHRTRDQIANRLRRKQKEKSTSLRDEIENYKEILQQEEERFANFGFTQTETQESLSLLLGNIPAANDLTTNTKKQQQLKQAKDASIEVQQHALQQARSTSQKRRLDDDAEPFNLAKQPRFEDILAEDRDLLNFVSTFDIPDDLDISELDINDIIDPPADLLCAAAADGQQTVDLDQALEDFLDL